MKTIFLDECTSNKLEQMVCWVYTSTVSQLPASVRQWWSGSDTRAVQIVEKVTSAFVSPQLCLQELSDVAKHENRFKNMVVCSNKLISCELFYCLFLY